MEIFSTSTNTRKTQIKQTMGYYFNICLLRLLYWRVDSEPVLSVHWKDWCWSWNSNTLATWCKELTHWKRPWCWERLKAGGEGDDRGWDGWRASSTQWTWVSHQGGLVCCGPRGYKALDMTERLNWTELNWASKESLNIYRIGKNASLTIPNVDKEAEILMWFWLGRKIGTTSLKRILATAKKMPTFQPEI